MKIEIRKEVRETKYVELPFYCKTFLGSSYFKIVSEEKCLRVCPDENTPVLSISHPSLAFELEPMEITEAEFNEVYELTKSYLSI